MYFVQQITYIYSLQLGPDQHREDAQQKEQHLRYVYTTRLNSHDNEHRYISTAYDIQGVSKNITLKYSDVVSI